MLLIGPWDVGVAMSSFPDLEVSYFMMPKYDTNSESVVIIGGKTAQDYDAIETLLRRVGKIDFFNDIQEEK